MKRSEMVQILKNAVNDMSDFDITDYAADELLKKLEDAGMAPPGESNWDSYGSGDDYHAFKTTTHEWESENA